MGDVNLLATRPPVFMMNPPNSWAEFMTGTDWFTLRIKGNVQSFQPRELPATKHVFLSCRSRGFPSCSLTVEDCGRYCSGNWFDYCSATFEDFGFADVVVAAPASVSLSWRLCKRVRTSSCQPRIFLAVNHMGFQAGLEVV